jgi:CRISPR-associated protein Csa1
MYFLSDDERRMVLRKLLPQARAEGVSEELRGWRWAEAPLAPIYETRLGVYEVAGQYCHSGRDLYLRRVLNVKEPPNQAMREGSALHALVATMLTTAKRVIYAAPEVEVGEIDGGNCLSALEIALAEANFTASYANDESLKQKIQLVHRYEYHRIIERVGGALAAQPHIGADALAAIALPMVVEQKLNGTLLGLSAHLSADAFTFAEPMVVDIKFGRAEDFHRLSTTGYALVMESIYEYPINLGCIVYPSFHRGRLTIERDFHIIGDELRQRFIDDRDQRARLIEEEIDPRLPAQCYEGCPFWQHCH